MVGIDLQSATIVEAGQLLRRRQLSPVELIQATLDRIVAMNPALQAYTTVSADYALRRARQAEHEIAAGQYRGPLHGIPYSLKDLIDTAGIRTTYGYRSHQDFVPHRSATVHVLLEEAGGVLVGKTTSHFRRSVPVECYNPWELSHSPGLSSAGSGSALAASLGLASLGSDTGGSVRIPAAYSGVVGLRATLGLISRHNALGPSWSFDQVGPMAKTVEDTAMVLQAVAAHDPEDPISLQEVVPDYRQGLRDGMRGVRVGVPREFFWENSTEDVATLVRRAVCLLEELGAEIAEVSLAHACEARGLLTVISEPESAVNYAEVFPKWRLDSLEPDLREYIERGRRYTMAEYLQAQRGAAVLRQELARAFKEVDVIVTPTCPTPALPISASLTTTKVRGRDVSSRALTIMFTAFASVAGLPALSVPCGFVDGRLPVGLQIVGRRLEEALVLRVGYAYEQATEWHLRHPDAAMRTLQGEASSAPKS
jgi:aspartyl-tRNA(Asn)/glutamyl-tRNA(Gln) amidotransferase subunit A